MMQRHPSIVLDGGHSDEDTLVIPDCARANAGEGYPENVHAGV